MIPMEEMEGRQSEDAFRFLIRSGSDAGYNVFRVW